MVDQEPSVLIVDDELSDVERIKKALAPIRLRISTTSDPHEVLRKVDSVVPDLVILDALLPGLSGFDLCKQIKTGPETKTAVVVILTGVYLKDHYRREAVQQFKADAFVTKPFRDKELQRLILKLLARKLQKSPGELQESIAHSQDILLSSELEAKPSWFDRLFGRLKTPAAPPVGSGFLHTAAEEEDGPGERDEDESDVVAPEEEAAAAVPTFPDRSGSAEEAEKRLPEVPPEEADSGAPTKAEIEERVEKDARLATEETGEPPLGQESAPAAGGAREGPVRKQNEEGERSISASESPPPSDTGAVDLESAQAVFEALGDDRATVIEMVEEETETERTLPAGARAPVAPAEPVPEVGGGVERTDVAGPEVPPQARRPKALLEDLPVYHEADYLYELKRELSMCNRVGSYLTLIVVRIADLDQIVELLGREYRPKVLLHVAQQALVSLREIDMVGLLESKELVSLTAFASGRYGGERIVSRLRAVLARHPFQVGVGLPSFIPDLRFGMAVYPKEAGDIEALMDQAEGALVAAPHSD